MLLFLNKSLKINIWILLTLSIAISIAFISVSKQLLIYKSRLAELERQKIANEKWLKVRFQQIEAEAEKLPNDPLNEEIRRFVNEYLSNKN